MGNYAFENTYNLTSDQLERLDEAEELMLKGAFGKAETLLLSMLEEDTDCIPFFRISATSTADTCPNSERQWSTMTECYALNPTTHGPETARRRYLRYVED